MSSFKILYRKNVSNYKSSSVLNYGAIPYPSTGMVNVNPDIEKLKSIGWKPEVTFEGRH